MLETVPNPQPRALLPGALHRAGIHHALSRDRPARLRPSGDRLRAARQAGREQVAEALSRQLPQPRRLSRGLHACHRPSALRKVLAPRWLRIGGYWYPRGGMPIDVFWQTGPPPEGPVAARPGRAALSRPVDEPTAADTQAPPRPATPAELRDAIRDEALRLGFDAVGFAPADLAPEARDERLQRLGEFLDAGWQGDMGWLGERTERARRSADPVARGARRVVSLAHQLRAADRSARGPGAARARGDLGLCPGPRLPRGDEEQAQGAGPLHLGHLPARPEGLRRHRAVDGEARGAGGRPSAGRASTPTSCRAQFGSWLFLGEMLLSVELPADAARDRPLRPVPRLPRRLPDQCLPGALPARCAALHLLPHHRA